ncbi:RadC family protein [Prevotella multiformis]|jgi:DNA repair protein radC|uniref:DNA repair protein RadC n=1 Tax=Prevotella multiformis DSM 16608 TaxID=888743 RepID=F0F4I9_9BACT|nr:DNA repair protein RadC [Prevotella multiformis]EGC21147.1 DNA repair protein RadC [Prevotella multiformis DSM 16608]QUB70656.1 DNA repair protein RadC [Prevotella multiformis]
MNEELNRLSINHWAEADRPREKLERLGAAALSDAELLAILIGSGTADESAVDLMKRILNDCKNNLNTLGKLSIRDLTTYKGIGPAKAISLLAACELGKRRQNAAAEKAPLLDNAKKVYQFMHTKIQDLDIEEGWMLMMKQNFRLIEAKRISIGGLTMAPVDIRLMMKEALLKNTTILAFCHNHPSGSTNPSREDDKLTTSIQKACSVLHIHFADHVILADGSYFSYREEGEL